MSTKTIGPITAALALTASLLFALLGFSAYAAEPEFPTGSRVGLVPPAGMGAAKSFPGFVDIENKAAILITAMPGAAYAEMEKTLAPDALKKQGITPEKRETLQLPIGSAVLITGTQIAPDKTPYRKWLLLAATPDVTTVVSVQAPEQSTVYSDATVRAVLNTLALRANVPETELLTMLPFKVGDLAGFRVANIIPGRALLLIDNPDYPHMVVTQNLPEYLFDARCTIVAVPAASSDKDARANFARAAFGSIGGIKDVQITMAEPVRLEHQDGFETVAHAKDAGSGADLMVVQWLRFGGGSTLQMVGIARSSIWQDELSRLRTMRASIDVK